MHALFAGRVMAIATQHKKEQILANQLERKLGVKCRVPVEINTDALGTFTGEIARSLSPRDAAREKCIRAMKELDCDLAIANEGSFGAHPAIPFCQADEELILLLDKKNQLELAAIELSTETNFNGAPVASLSQAYDFAMRAGFPSHTLIMRPYQDAPHGIVKDIHTWSYLSEVFNQMMLEYGSAYLETDLRAMNNPTRRKVIARALDKLIDLIDSECPRCKMPGFSENKVSPGLPCRECGSPTRAVISLTKLCPCCGYEEVVWHPRGEYEDAQFCDVCNP